jgi:hypothetical protein
LRCHHHRRCQRCRAAVCWLVVSLLSTAWFRHVMACCHATADALLLATFPDNCLKLVFWIKCCLGKLMFLFCAAHELLI